MRIRRLSWAGVTIEAAGATLVIDPLEDAAGALRLGMGPPREALVPAGPDGSADGALVTHAHPDHFDPRALRRLLGGGGAVFCPRGMERRVLDAGLAPRAMEAGASAQVGRATVAAVESVDGFGDPQLAWVVEAEGRRVLHCGDTLWHGAWWRIARLHGPFDVAFLPVNAPLVEPPGLPPSGIPAAMSPEQAAAAAALVGARAVCPIHHGTFHCPPAYAETDHPLERLRAAAAARGVEVLALAPGEWAP
ncbi:MAG TPA: MBL fold metallo-hydrolase [Longimicrobiaceae bacterium]|nr:MBL fold metallo-hydrolase [Longimicrobiaceae bacterium]